MNCIRSDKGKPIERWGRKATGLSWQMDYRHLANTTAELPKTDFEKRAGQKQVGGQHAFLFGKT
jgi:hypothetical protein